MKWQTIINRILVVVWFYLCFYLQYRETFTENATLSEMILYVLHFFTRPAAFIIDKLLYS
jgi:hypothetical protein